MIGDGQRVDEVAVSIDKAGKEGFSLQVYHTGFLATALQNRGAASNSHDFAILYRQRFSRRARVVHGDDVPVGINRVSGQGIGGHGSSDATAE